MSNNLGDFAPSTVVYGMFTTYQPSTGANFVLAGTPAVSVYKDASDTQSTSGVTLTASADSVVGLNRFTIDTSSDGTFYSAGSFFNIVITTGTVDSVSVVGSVVGSFTINKTSALRPTTAGRTLLVDASGNADARLADAVSHGGTLGSSTATIAMSRVNVTSQTSNTTAVTLLGNGTGHGLSATSGSGATGNGIVAASGATNGSGLALTGTGTGSGLLTGSITNSGTTTFTGATTYTGNVGYTNGVFIAGGSQVHALQMSAAAGGDGIRTTGNTTGHGINAVAGASGLGVLASSATVTGAAILGSLTNNGATVLTGNVSLGGTLGVAGTTTLAAVNTGAVGTGNITVTGTLGISGTTTLAAVTTTGTVTMNALTVSNATTLTGAVSATNAGNDIRGISLSVSGLAAFFTTDSGETYASSVAGSVVQEIADNAGGASLTVQQIVDGVWDEAIAAHLGAGSTGEALDDASVPPTVPTADQNADALLARNVAGGSSAGRLVKEAFYVMRNRTDIAGGTLTVYEVDDATPAWTATVTTTPGDPISQINP